jgi:hypothetical protein
MVCTLMCEIGTTLVSGDALQQAYAGLQPYPGFGKNFACPVVLTFERFKISQKLANGSGSVNILEWKLLLNLI